MLHILHILTYFLLKIIFGIYFQDLSSRTAVRMRVYCVPYSLLVTTGAGGTAGRTWCSHLIRSWIRAPQMEMKKVRVEGMVCACVCVCVEEGEGVCVCVCVRWLHYFDFPNICILLHFTISLSLSNPCFPAHRSGTDLVKVAGTDLYYSTYFFDIAFSDDDVNENVNYDSDYEESLLLSASCRGEW
jgi:hypothetical protein